MADPRFYDNTGPFTLAQICAAARVVVPAGADGGAQISDVAHLAGASPTQVSFFLGGKSGGDFSATSAGFCFVPETLETREPLPDKTVLIPCASVQHAFAAAARTFYPDYNLMIAPQAAAIDPTARIGENVILAPSVVIGPGAEIGAGTRIGAGAVIDRGVSIGARCEIGSNVSITHAYVGDEVTVLPGAQIGQPGFGFAGADEGHTKIPQLGRVLIQNRVEIGACTTIDRGALGDTVIGEGTKIDNLVQVGHTAQIGRHCIIVSQCGISGSSVLGDFVTLGGQVGIADHCRIGSGARLAGRTALITGQKIEGERDYAGVPAKPLRDWIREVYAVAALIKKNKAKKND